MILIADVFEILRTAKDVVRQISKESLFIQPFNKQHDERSKTLLKSARQQLNHIY